MIGWIASGLSFCADLVGDGKAVDALKIVVDEFDKRRLIDYGRLQVKDASREKLDAIIADTLAYRDKIQQQIKDEGITDDGYRRS